jgi:hypothetical protein
LRPTVSRTFFGSVTWPFPLIVIVMPTPFYLS